MRTLALVRRAADLALVRAGAPLAECRAVALLPPDEARPLLQAARQAGAVHATQLWDAALESVDYLGVATALAAVVRTTTPDLSGTVILAGDRGRGAVGAALAERLQLPLLAQVTGVERDGERLLARRRFRGVLKLYAVTPPAVVGLLVDETAPTPGAGEAKGDIEGWTLERVGLTAAELIYRRRFVPHLSPGPDHKPRRMADVRALLGRLRADGLVPPKGQR
jgi:electron transfer flavoprotein alpha/beta subunit